MDTLTILNYQGSKKKLLEFIHESLDEYINQDDVILDIFSGTASIAYSYKRTNMVYTNDAEKYAATVARALLGNHIEEELVDLIKRQYTMMQSDKYKEYASYIGKENEMIEEEDLDGLIELYESLPSVWKTNGKFCGDKESYSLFFNYYSGSYFGIKQACDIDCIRHVIDIINKDKDIMLACLFFAMKECVFSKDGHMAQPLDIKKNKTKMFKLRKRDVYLTFCDKLKDFYEGNLIENEKQNQVFNCDFEELLNSEAIKENVTVIYADPPYTDMQYSRYYHLLNTVVEYDYPNMTESRGKYTKGLYLDNRFQSQLSRKSTCLDSMKQLISFSFENNICLAISFAYPQNTEKQKTDRYVMDISDLISACEDVYGKERVKVKEVNYEHSNNRNSKAKKVIEYLIICEREV